jgi:hypothetical protein
VESGRVTARGQAHSLGVTSAMWCGHKVSTTADGKQCVTSSNAAGLAALSGRVNPSGYDPVSVGGARLSWLG